MTTWDLIDAEVREYSSSGDQRAKDLFDKAITLAEARGYARAREQAAKVALKQGEHWYVAYGSVMVQAGDKPGDEDFLMECGGANRTARKRLASAAPDMARALKALHDACVDRGRDSLPEVDSAMLALRKAGVQ